MLQFRDRRFRIRRYVNIFYFSHMSVKLHFYDFTQKPIILNLGHESMLLWLLLYSVNYVLFSRLHASFSNALLKSITWCWIFIPFIVPCMYSYFPRGSFITIPSLLVHINVALLNMDFNNLFKLKSLSTFSLKLSIFLKRYSSPISSLPYYLRSFILPLILLLILHPFHVFFRLIHIITPYILYGGYRLNVSHWKSS